MHDFRVDMAWESKNRGVIHMNLIYKRATIQDLNFLTKSRIEVLKAANKLADDVDMA